MNVDAFLSTILIFAWSDDIARFRLQLALPRETRRGYLVRIDEGGGNEVAADEFEATSRDKRALRDSSRTGAWYRVLKSGLDPSEPRSLKQGSNEVGEISLCLLRGCG